MNQSQLPPSLTYKDAGVDIDAGNDLVERIKPAIKTTQRTGSDTNIGGFGGLFDLAACNYKDPVLVAGTDGVGTKLEIANKMNIHHTVGIDLVAMVVNDLVVQGAEPLFFLDYFATGALPVDQASEVITGIAEGCKEAGCALIGGETAEMPGLYQPGDYDLAGFAVGAVERNAILPRNDMAEGDILLGLPSSGIHSNGFSLVRHVVKQYEIDYHSTPNGLEQSLGETLLTPTRIYIKSCLPLAQNKLVKAMAHITGGGITENLPRVLPDHLAAHLDCSAWQRPAIYHWLQQQGNAGIALEEMLRTFNCGIGMILVVNPDQVDAVKASLKEQGEICYTIGSLAPREGDAVIYSNEASLRDG